MRILIVTFAGDLPLLKLQLESINKFLEPCMIDIIVNEPSSAYVRNQAQPWITRMKHHDVMIHSGEDNLNFLYGDRYRYDYTSWHCQQIHKLINHLDEPYVVLDTKDIFIKPTSLADITKHQPKWFLRDDKRTHIDFLKFAWEAFLLSGRTDIYEADRKFVRLRSFVTPFYMDPRIIKNVLKDCFDGSLEDFVSWFFSFDFPSEFLLHDIFDQKYKLTDPSIEDLKIDFCHTIRHTKYKNYVWKDNWHKEITDKTHILKIHINVFEDKKVQKDVWRYFNELPS